MIERRSPEPRHAGILQKLEKARKQVFALEPPEGTILAHTLTLAPGTDGLVAFIAARE